MGMCLSHLGLMLPGIHRGAGITRLNLFAVPQGHETGICLFPFCCRAEQGTSLGAF